MYHFNLICNGCKHFVTKTTSDHPGVKFLLYGCKIKKITFGVEHDLNKKCPKACKEKEV